MFMFTTYIFKVPFVGNIHEKNRQHCIKLTWRPYHVTVM